MIKMKFIELYSKRGVVFKLDLGGKIKRLRMLKGISALALSKQVGLVPSQISKIENNSSKPSLDALFKICEALDVPVSVLFDDEKPEISVKIREIDKELSKLSEKQLDALLFLISSFTKQLPLN